MRQSSSHSALRGGGHLTLNDAARMFGSPPKTKGIGQGRGQKTLREGPSIVHQDARMPIVRAIVSTSLAHLTRRPLAGILFPADPEAGKAFLDWIFAGASCRKTYEVPGGETVEAFLARIAAFPPR